MKMKHMALFIEVPEALSPEAAKMIIEGAVKSPNLKINSVEDAPFDYPTYGVMHIYRLVDEYCEEQGLNLTVEEKARVAEKLWRTDEGLAEHLKQAVSEAIEEYISRIDDHET